MTFLRSLRRFWLAGDFFNFRRSGILALALAGGLLTMGCSSSYQDLHPEDYPWKNRTVPEPEIPAAAPDATPAPAPATQTSATTNLNALPPIADKSSPAGIVELMRRAANWQLANPTTDDRKSWIYAAFYDGVMALGRINGNGKYLEDMLQQGEDNRWQLGPRNYHADDHAVAQMYLEMYELKNDPDMYTSVQQGFDFILDFPKANPDDLDYAKPGRDDKWSWCDSLFMDPPAWARLSKVTGDPKYLDSANERWWITSQYLYDPREHLYSRDSTFFTKREPNGEKVFWARGNGWVLAGLARMLDYMPKDFPDRAKYEKQFRDMAAKLKTLQQPDGLWRAGLLDPDSYPDKEESGSAFFTYGLAWGINHGLLDKDEYTPVVMKAWAALADCEQPNGKIAHVQPVASQPVGFDPNSSKPYGVGAFLLAGSEVYKLVGGK
ncbi:MAG TPA: glycoside hydrolase family 88 protein [Opitutales bacterium]|nr:glycoside hydrolase family 88 protein [Opitutales bacterium]